VEVVPALPRQEVENLDHAHKAVIVGIRAENAGKALPGMDKHDRGGDKQRQAEILLPGRKPAQVAPNKRYCVVYHETSRGPGKPAAAPRICRPKRNLNGFNKE
jgi:hypothetical protein